MVLNVQPGQQDFEAWEIDLHGHNVVYRTMGSGPPVVLIHGMVDSSRHWRGVAERLAEHHTVIAPVPHLDDPEGLAEALEEFIEATEPVHHDEASWRDVLRRRSEARPRPRAVA